MKVEWDRSDDEMDVLATFADYMVSVGVADGRRDPGEYVVAIAGEGPTEKASGFSLNVRTPASGIARLAAAVMFDGMSLRTFLARLQEYLPAERVIGRAIQAMVNEEKL